MKLEIGQKIHMLTLISKRFKDCGSYKKTFWLCECECGKKKEVRQECLIRKSRHVTKSCGCHKLALSKRTIPAVGEITARMIREFRRAAKDKGVAFNLTKENLNDLILKQDYKCALSGKPISLQKCIFVQKRMMRSASLDRIDSFKGYTIDNVQWVHIRPQIMKQDMETKELLNWCQEILDNHK